MTDPTPRQLLEEADKARPKGCILVYITEKDEIRVAISRMGFGEICYLERLLQSRISTMLSSQFVKEEATKIPALTSVPNQNLT